MATNHFGHFLLSNLLLPLLCETSISKGRPKTDPVRIVVVSSVMHWYGKVEMDNLNSEKYFKPSRIYSDTKLANLLFTFELNRKLKAEGYDNVIVNAVHPGPVQTNLFRNIPYYGWIIKFLLGLLYYSPKVKICSFIISLYLLTILQEGAQTSIYCAVAEETAHISGSYFSGCKLAKCSPEATDIDLAKSLWEKSAQIVDLMPHETVVWH